MTKKQLRNLARSMQEYAHFQSGEKASISDCMMLLEATFQAIKTPEDFDKKTLCHPAYYPLHERPIYQKTGCFYCCALQWINANIPAN